MGFFYKPSGGGGDANDPTFPTTPLSIASDVSGTSFTLTNSGTTPASVELSFASDTGSESLLIGSDYDQGTDRSPTYVVDPDTGTRTVNLVRGTLFPSDPSSNEIVTLTSNAGILPQTITTTVNYPLLRAYIRAAGDPTYEFLFDGNFNNTGSIGGTSTAYGMTANSDTSTYTGVIGYGDITSTTSRHQMVIARPTYLKTTVDRSWIHVLHIISDTAGAHSSVNFGASTHTGPGWLTNLSTVMGFTVTGANPSTVTFDTSGQHTDGGSSEAFTRSAGVTYITCASYDFSAKTITYRWKKTGDRAGHSYVVATSARYESNIGNTTCYFSGFSSNCYHNIRYLNHSVIDAVVSESQFNSMASTLSL